MPASNRPLDPEEVRRIESDYAGFRRRHSEAFFGVLGGFVSNGPSAQQADPTERQRALEASWEAGGAPTFLNTYDDIMTDAESNEIVRDFVAHKIREIVTDPQVASKLIPTQTFGCKRICIDSDYFFRLSTDPTWR